MSQRLQVNLIASSVVTAIVVIVAAIMYIFRPTLHFTMNRLDLEERELKVVVDYECNGHWSLDVEILDLASNESPGHGPGNLFGSRFDRFNGRISTQFRLPQDDFVELLVDAGATQTAHSTTAIPVARIQNRINAQEKVVVVNVTSP
ncbi:MAG: hypothetical protein KF861_00655 [Planctomycetaceae bacterium]|nr:hypothetical protein [Planctomycetaceae bacterium]